jgi:hypothetical protein
MYFNRYSLPLVIILILVGSRNYLYPQDSLYSPHPLHVKDASVSVQGVYWQLPFAGVDSITLNSNKLTVKGHCDSSTAILNLCEVTRTIPSELAVTKVIPDTQRAWFESDVITGTMGNPEQWRKFYNRTGDRFYIGDSFHSLYQIGHTYQGPGDTIIIVLAFGKMKQDAKTWMGYILIAK